MDYIEWFPERLAELRLQKGVSARDMSLSLGQSESYINKIENRRTLPSMAGFFYICDFLEISPEEFFATQNQSDPLNQAIALEAEKLSPQYRAHVLQLIQDLAQKDR